MWVELKLEIVEGSRDRRQLGRSGSLGLHRSGSYVVNTAKNV